MTYSAQNNLISTLPGGTWHMATATDMGTLKADNSAADINNFFLPIGTSLVNIDFSQNPPVFTFANIFVGRYDRATGSQHYVGTMDWDTTDNVVYYPTSGESMFLNSTASDAGWGGIGAWVVTDSYTPNAVPIPPTLLLFGSGLLGLAGWRRLIKG